MDNRPRYTPDANADSPGTGQIADPAEPRQVSRASGVRYGAMNWIGEFRLPPTGPFKYGAKLVVQSDRGIELGEQVGLTCRGCGQPIKDEQIEKYLNNSGPEFYRLKAGKILREASPQDIAEHERLNRHIRADIERCTKLAGELGLDIKVVTAEHLLGGERIVFYFRSEGRIDFRDLVRELAQHYQTRIEMRQVGARDEARLIADYEVCGRQCCCKNFLKKLRPITMRMAKLQKSTLDPSKVSGRCGRLRCCLRYEHEGYDELLRRLPRLGARVQTSSGPGTVVDRQVLTQLVVVRSDDERELAIPLEEISPSDAPVARPAAPEREAEGPADKPDFTKPPAEQPEEPPRRRRRGRRRRKTTDDAPTPSTESTTPRPPTREASPQNGDRASSPPATEPDTPEQTRPQPRRRRRRPRRNRPDSGPGGDTDKHDPANGST
jgi:cell fate regulator YaaT (PSP1 superfamily)